MSSLKLNPKLIRQKQLLWTNPNTTISYNATSNIVDVANYKEIIVDFVVSTTDSGTHYIVHKFIDDFTTRGSCKTYDNSYGNVLSSRDVSTIDNKVIVGAGYYFGVGSSNSEGQDNKFSIPYKIYGILN